MIMQEAIYRVPERKFACVQSRVEQSRRGMMCAGRHTTAHACGGPTENMELEQVQLKKKER